MSHLDQLDPSSFGPQEAVLAPGGILRIRQREVLDVDPGGRFCAWSSDGGRTDNQDGYYISPDAHGIAVADGMGGREEGATAAESALKTFGQPTDLRASTEAFLRSFLSNDVKTGCTTLLGLTFHPDKNPGDWRADFLQWGDGFACFLHPKLKAYRKLGCPKIGRNIIFGPNLSVS